MIIFIIAQAGVRPECARPRAQQHPNARTRSKYSYVSPTHVAAPEDGRTPPNPACAIIRQPGPMHWDRAVVTDHVGP